MSSSSFLYSGKAVMVGGKRSVVRLLLRCTINLPASGSFLYSNNQVSTLSSCFLVESCKRNWFSRTCLYLSISVSICLHKCKVYVMKVSSPPLPLQNCAKCWNPACVPKSVFLPFLSSSMSSFIHHLVLVLGSGIEEKMRECTEVIR